MPVVERGVGDVTPELVDRVGLLSDPKQCDDDVQLVSRRKWMGNFGNRRLAVFLEVATG